MTFDLPLLLILDNVCLYLGNQLYCPFIQEIYFTVPFVFPCLTNFVIYLYSYYYPPSPPPCLPYLYILLSPFNFKFCLHLSLFNFWFFCLILSSSLSSIIFSPPFLNHFVPFSVLYHLILSFLNHFVCPQSFFISPFPNHFVSFSSLNYLISSFFLQLLYVSLSFLHSSIILSGSIYSISLLSLSSIIFVSLGFVSCMLTLYLISFSCLHFSLTHTNNKV